MNCVGRSGKLAMMRKKEVSLEICVILIRWFTVMWNLPPNWSVNKVYGSLKAEKKGDVWDELRSLWNRAHNSWLMLGNFNEILANTEKYGRSLIGESQMAEFKQVIEDCELSDLKFKGNIFT